MNDSDSSQRLSGGPICPLPLDQIDQVGRGERVLLAHGGGGRLMNQLIERLILPAFGNDLLNQRHDGAVFELGGVRLAMSTDSYVVQPLVFPGGDIGTLSVYGTVNDLAMCGARPCHLSVGLIIEEGLPFAMLERVIDSMAQAAARAGVTLVTGDTKVVERGKADGLFINTAGIGVIEHPLIIAPDQVRPGDLLLLNGDLGRHAIAIMATREGLTFETTIESDCAPLHEPIQGLIAAGIEVHCLRDLTRGGLASALVEIATAAGCQILLDEGAIPVGDDVRGACEILGLDPLYLANEGRFVAFVPAADAPRALELLRESAPGCTPTVIGQVQDGRATRVPPRVIMKTTIGTTRLIEMFSGEQLPRIC